MPSRACSRACPAGVSFRTFDRSPVDAEGRTTFHACAPPRPFPQGTTGALPSQCLLSHRRSWSFPYRACSCCTLPRLSPWRQQVSFVACCISCSVPPPPRFFSCVLLLLAVPPPSLLWSLAVTVPCSLFCFPFPSLLCPHPRPSLPHYLPGFVGLCSRGSLPLLLTSCHPPDKLPPPALAPARHHPLLTAVFGAHHITLRDCKGGEQGRWLGGGHRYGQGVQGRLEGVG